MSGLYDPREPYATNRFQGRTESHASMAGVAIPRFRCVRCKIHQPTMGRKQVSPGFPRDGYICKGCAK